MSSNPGDAFASAEGIQVRYGAAIGVQDVSYSVGSGQVVAILGPTGAGKTTSIRALGGFLSTEGARVTQGRVQVAGTEVTNAEPHKVSRLGVSLVPERKKIFPNMSVGENLGCLGNKLSKRRKSEILDRAYELFPSIAGREREAAGRLSGGQQQMLAIARGLLSEPKLLVMDEMTLGLHHSLHQPLLDAVAQIVSDGTSVLIVDENVDFAVGVADYCYLLVNGRVAVEGPAAKFKDRELVASAYVQGEIA